MRSSGSLSAQQEQKTQSFTLVSIQKNIEPWRDKRILRLYRIWPLIPKSYVVSEWNRNLLISECEYSQICSLLRSVPCACVRAWLSVYLQKQRRRICENGKTRKVPWANDWAPMYACLWSSLQNGGKDSPCDLWQPPSPRATSSWKHEMSVMWNSSSE